MDAETFEIGINATVDQALPPNRRGVFRIFRRDPGRALGLDRGPGLEHGVGGMDRPNGSASAYVTALRARTSEPSGAK